MPSVSVIVPVYKVEPYLRRCVDSILAQTYTDFELILVDDGSPDNCGVICDEYAAKDKRVHVIHQENQGLATARNHGLKWIFSNSNSEYVTFIDSDDWVHAKYLELLYKGIEAFDAGMSQCGFVKVFEERESPAVGEQMLCVTPDEQYIRWFSTYAWGKLYHKDLFREIWYPDGEIFEDVLIWHKILFSFSRISIVDATLYFYFQRDGITKREWSTAKLAQIRAWDAQLECIAHRENQNVLQAALPRFFWVYKHQFGEIEDSTLISPEEKREYQSALKQKMKNVLHRYRSELFASGIYWKVLTWTYLLDDRSYHKLSALYRKIRRI